MRTKLLGALAGACLLAVSGTAEAGPVTFDYTGTVSDFSDPLGALPSSVASGSGFELSYTFESSISDEHSSSNVGFYRHSSGLFTDFTVTIGDAVFSLHPTATGGNILVFDDFSPNGDVFQSVGFLDDGYGYVGIRAIQEFRDSSADAFASDALPLTAPNVADFTDRNFFRLFGILSGFSDPFFIDGTIDAFQASDPVAVPEPPSMALFAAGLAALVWLAAWRRQPKA